MRGRSGKHPGECVWHALGPTGVDGGHAVSRGWRRQVETASSFVLFFFFSWLSTLLPVSRKCRSDHLAPPTPPTPIMKALQWLFFNLPTKDNLVGTDWLRTLSADLSLTFQDTLCSGDDWRLLSKSHAAVCPAPLAVLFSSSWAASENYSLFSQRPSLGRYSSVAHQANCSSSKVSQSCTHRTVNACCDGGSSSPPDNHWVFSVYCVPHPSAYILFNLPTNSGGAFMALYIGRHS